MSRRPLIGVTSPRGRGWALWAGAWLSLRLHGARARRIMPPLERAALDDLDGLVIGGGDDIGADLYGGTARLDVRVDPERDRLELAALALFWDNGRPVLGICRGAQMINVYRGGALHRDVRESFKLRRHPRTPLALKTVDIVAGGRLSDALQMARLRVNSLHSQAVARLGDGVTVAACDEHGMIQAIEAEGPAFRVGVQWHPELLFYRTGHRRLFGAFVAAARGRMAG